MAASRELVPLDQYAALAAGPEALDLVRDTLQGQQVSEFDLVRVRTPSGGGTTFEIPSRIGEGESSKSLEGVILFHTTSRAYWASAYSGGSEPPTCSSPDGATAEPRDESVDIPATPEPETGRLLCHTCRYNEWGTAVNEHGQGTRGKACRETRQVFMLTPSRMLPLVLVLPPTSLQGFKQFLMGLMDEQINWRNTTAVATLRKVEGGGPAYSQVEFRVGQALDPAMAEQVGKYRAACEPAFKRYTVENVAANAAQGADASQAAGSNGGEATAAEAAEQEASG